MAARVLVADDDLWILRMISTVLERRGHSVTLASDGEEALAAAVDNPPDLLITDINMPRMDGWQLIEALRQREHLANLPVIVLSEMTDEDSRVRGYKLGVEDYVAKPFRFDELDLRVSKTLRRPTTGSDAEDQDAPPDVGLVGSLDQVSLSSLLTMFELDGKTGVLQLSRVETPEATLWMRAGRIVAAELDGAGDLSDAEQIYRVLTWTSGRFEFHAQAVDVEDRVKRRTTALLMEGARRIDEAGR